MAPRPRPVGLRSFEAGARRALRAARSLGRPLPRLDGYRPESTLVLPQTSVTAAAVPAVDVHNHLGRWLSRDGGWMAPDVPRLVDDLDALNVRSVVNLDGRWGDELEENLDRYDRSHPQRFATFCQLDWALLAERDGPARLLGSLRDSAARGAAGIKVWKDLGRSVRDARGALVLPDDHRLHDLWRLAGELGLPVLIHVADPVAFFRPADARNERLEEIRRHRASWDVAGLPTHDRLVDALEGAVTAAPRTTWIAAHVASLVEDLGRVSALLDRHPRLHVDVAARVGDLGRQPRAAAAFVRRHLDRVLFGTDVFPVRTVEVQIYFRFLESLDEYFPYSAADVPPAGRWTISGLGLSEPELRRVYAENALRLLPRLDA